MDWRYHIYKKLGYSVYSRETAGKTLEFLGTSGAGKTTLYRETVVKRKSRWLQAHHLEGLKRTTPPCQIDDVLMRILKSRMDTIFNSDTFCGWHSFMDLKLSVRVMRETMLVTHVAQPTGVAFDEGFFRHFPAEILEQGDDIPLQLWENRAFVYVRARSAETALARVSSRTARLAQIERQRSKSEDQILEKINLDQEMFQTIVDKGLGYGCPVLVVDAENPFHESVAQVLQFESSLNQRFEQQSQINETLNSTP